MKNKIYVFSGTGNSLDVAKKVQNEISNTEIIKISYKLFNKPITIDTDILGFVFPVHYFGPPVIIRYLLNIIKSIKANYVFAIETNGGGGGRSLKIFSKLLKKKNLTLNSSFSILMPSNHIKMKETIMYGIDNEIKLINAENKIMDISTTISNKINTGFPKSNFIFSLFSILWNPVYVKDYHSKTNKLDKNFILGDNCNGCRICQEICPVNNIILNDLKKPQWQHKCECCMACIQWCPERAIEYGNISQVKKQYQNPNISVNEMFID